ncbi:MAG: Holliday junction branch migration protein RuvA [Candidatus Eisenbacteria bacterium]|jgi:Holliday junction DNA helicase RuvA|nr:Holliday junction branch migration protein RuvA [Candidatus Eisenbacteria bacterium]
MIDRITGTVSKVEPAEAVIDLGCVSLRMVVPISTSSRLSTGDRAALWAELVVREDSMALFGFATEKERAYFNLLRSVAGIGPKLACTVLSGTSVDGLEQAISRGEPGMLSRIPGIGRKTAGRIVMELSGKIEQVLRPSGAPLLASSEATDALVSLGYQRQLAARAVDGVVGEVGADASAEEVLRAALKSLSSGRRGKA